MSDLERWASDGATNLEADLLRAARASGPTPRARAKIAAAVLSGASVGAAATTAAGSAARAGMLPMSAKWIAILVVGGAGAAWTWQNVRTAAPSDSDRHTTSFVAPSDPSLRPTSSAPSIPVEALPSADCAPRCYEESPVRFDASAPGRGHVATARVAPAGAAPADVESTLDSELRILERAKVELDNHDPASTLSLLDEYQRFHPRGVLSMEARVLRIDALVASGRSREAAAAAKSFVAAHPTAAQTPRLQTLLESIEK